MLLYKCLIWSICLFFLVFPLPEETQQKKKKYIYIYIAKMCQRVYYLCFLLEVLWFQILHLISL